MAYNAHFIAAHEHAMVSIRDDRGIPATELELPATVEHPQHAEDELKSAGWTTTAEWTTVDDGWVAPVVRTATE